MKLEIIFIKIEECNEKIFNETNKLNSEVEKLWDKEADLIQMENELIFNSEDYAELKNDRQRTSFIKNETLSESFEIMKQKQRIANIKNNIELYKNMKSMYNRMLDNDYFEGDDN